ncbi:hypothetical protein AHiyo6_03350 [Arthrobacter sp. Hiyo6]|jgi:hypothetical protein|nr:hypothetical protein AHiyo6_03350 [Arthrobacter sp. Hiyo6]
MEKELITAEPNAGPHGEAVSATQSVCSESGLLELAAQHFPPLRVVGVRDVDEAIDGSSDIRWRVGLAGLMLGG